VANITCNVVFGANKNLIAVQLHRLNYDTGIVEMTLIVEKKILCSMHMQSINIIIIIFVGVEIAITRETKKNKQTICHLNIVLQKTKSFFQKTITLSIVDKHRNLEL
jgi:hypothetical protein